MLSAAGSALRARVRASDAAVVERALATVRDDVATEFDPVVAISRIRSGDGGTEGEIEVETSEPVSRRGLRRITARTEGNMRRLGYTLDRQVVADGGQVVSVYIRHRRTQA
jgi:hypothetical protein